MKIIVAILLLFFFGEAVHQVPALSGSATILGKGQVPDLATAGDTVHVVWGKGDSIVYTFSTNKGLTFSAPMVVDVVPKLFSFAMRGPQITAIRGGACIIACNQQGNLFSYQKNSSGGWRKAARVNDADTTVKEGFLDLSGDGDRNLFAAWLDLRKGGHNNIVGARSTDGGRTWSANRLLYVSPDGHTCECCKPSVAVQGHNVSVMFRNWTGGNRDLWLLRSVNGGQAFGAAEKLGKGSWRLDGCPMDGGGMAWDKNGKVQTVWRRRDSIFAAMPGKVEAPLGRGKACTLAAVENGVVYAWVENGAIVLRTPANKKLQIGEGSLPCIKAVDKNKVLLVWEKDKEIQKAMVSL
jgi:hypothetical protein